MQSIVLSNAGKGAFDVLNLTFESPDKVFGFDVKPCSAPAGYQRCAV